MSSSHALTMDLLKSWLDEMGSEFYVCRECDGLHLPALQDAAGVIDSRLFLEDYGLLLTTELEVRPAALLHVSADLGRLNMDYPTLKVFLDVVDEAVPQLVVGANLCLGSDMIVVAWLATSSGVLILSAGRSGEEVLIAITRSAPIFLVTSTGMGSTRPPSTKSLSSDSTGLMAKGMAMVALSASARSPESKTTLSPVTRSVVTARQWALSALTRGAVMARRWLWPAT